MHDKEESERPAAIVLSSGLTGLATVRGLTVAGVAVHAATMGHGQVTDSSRRCRPLRRPDKPSEDASSVQWLIDACASFPSRPVVLPTSDEDALWLARHADRLRPHCRYSTSTHAELLRIVSKDGLYAAAIECKVPVVPAITEPSFSELDEWSRTHQGPYLLKPFYNLIPDSALRSKNLLLGHRDELLAYVQRAGSRALIVQRKIDGGDGHILDCYGLCDASGTPVTMASHRRIRQCPPHFGATSYGEIPALGDDALEARLFELTARLLAGLRYHGIFGIEWLHDRATDELYVIDFNARPFSSIGHLTACGLNLPWLAYRELVGDDLSDVPARPALKHLYWVDLASDFGVYCAGAAGGLGAWLRSILACRSFAVWHRTDPVPWLRHTLRTLVRAIRKSRRILRTTAP